jgi:hypothetical protein
MTLRPNDNQDMGYEYDVFLSYLHSKPSGTFVAQHFLQYFPSQLSNALGGREAKIFYDREGIHTGQRWPARLKQALATSRCLVGIWCPSYFHSPWCMNECAVMLHREQKLGFSGGNPDGLIAGVKVHDGIHFPDYAQNSQYADFEDVFYDEAGFAHSPKYIDFQQKVKNLATDVAALISKVPLWSPEWATPAWTDDVIARLSTPPPAKAAQPLLSS